MKGKKLIAVRIILICLVIALAVVIFCLSADGAEASNSKSDRIAGPFVEMIDHCFDLNDKQIDRAVDICVFAVRKAAHFSEYALLGFLVACVSVSFQKPNKITLAVSQATASLYAVSDEVHQYFVPGRSCQLRDVIIDSLGALTGIILLLFLISVYKKINQKKALKRSVDNGNIQRNEKKKANDEH